MPSKCFFPKLLCPWSNHAPWRLLTNQRNHLSLSQFLPLLYTTNLWLSECTALEFLPVKDFHSSLSFTAIPEHTVVQWQLNFSLHSYVESIYLWMKGRLFSSPPGINRIHFWSLFLFSSVAQSCPTLCDPMDCSMPGLPVHHQLPEFTQTLVHWVSDANQSSQSLSSTSPPTFNLSQHQGLFMSLFFTSGGQSIRASSSASALPMNIQDWFPLGWTGWFSLQCKGLSRVFPNTTVQKHQFFSTQPSLWSDSHIHTWLLEKP